jgi:predicted nucleic acid-binding Zn ribbon protein
MSRDYSINKYKLFKSQGGKKSHKKNAAEQSERAQLDDPQAIKSVLAELKNNKTWNQKLSQGSLFNNWEEIVGVEIAFHTNPITILDGELTIQTTSTAWAVQLNLIQSEILKTITESAAGALVERIKIIPPKSRSWKKGPLASRDGRGVRDTYN